MDLRPEDRIMRPGTPVWQEAVAVSSGPVCWECGSLMFSFALMAAGMFADEMGDAKMWECPECGLVVRNNDLMMSGDIWEGMTRDDREAEAARRHSEEMRDRGVVMRATAP
jgi:hypothetical protein